MSSDSIILQVRFFLLVSLLMVIRLAVPFAPDTFYLFEVLTSKPILIPSEQPNEIASFDWVGSDSDRLYSFRPILRQQRLGFR